MAKLRVDKRDIDKIVLQLKGVTNEMESVIDDLKVLRGMVPEGPQRELVDNCIQRLERAID